MSQIGFLGTLLTGPTGPQGPIGPPGEELPLTVHVSSPSFAAGRAVTQTSGQITLANTAALATVLMPTGVAIEAGSAGLQIKVVTQGVVDPAVINLGAGVACAVGLNSSGVPVRVTDVTCASGLKYVGVCDSNGAIYVSPRSALQISVADFGAINDATTDDTTAVQAAITFAVANGIGSVYFPPGPGYIITATLVATGAVMLIGPGKPAGGGGTTGITNLACLIHNFSGDLIHFNGASGTGTSQGGGVRWLRLYQKYNTDGTTPCGNAITVDCSDENHRPGYMDIGELTIDEGAANPWTWGIVIDGDNDHVTPGISNMLLHDLDTHTSNSAGGAVKIKTATVTAYDCHGSLEANWTITGSSGFPAGSVQLVNVSINDLSLDYAQDFTFVGGILGGNVTTTAHTSGKCMVLPGRFGGGTVTDASTSSLGLAYYDDTNVGNAPGSFRFTKPITLRNSSVDLNGSLFLGLNAAENGTIIICFVDSNNVVRLGQNSPVGFGNNPTVTNTNSGDIVMTNGVDIRFTDQSGPSAKAFLSIGAADQCIIGREAADIQWGKAQVALGAGAGATLGTVGGSGPTTAGQSDWLRIKASDGSLRWIPCWL